MPKREVTSAPWVPVPARAYTGKAPRARQHRAVGRLSAGAPRLHKSCRWRRPQSKGRSCRSGRARRDLRVRGAIRVTDEPATLPADAAQSELCPTICLACSDAEVTDDESSVAGQEEEDTQHGSVASVLAAKAETFRYAALGPRGAPPVPDPAGWREQQTRTLNRARKMLEPLNEMLRKAQAIAAQRARSGR